MMPAKVRAAAVVLVLALAGCSSDNSTNSRPTLVCDVKQLRLQGSIDDAPIDISETASGFFFANKVSAAPGSLGVTLASGDFKLEFDTLTAFGGKSAARGFIKHEPSALSVGNCETGPFPSTMSISSDGNTISFSLNNLLQEPYCGGQAVAGSLSGCFRTE
jgi:hypothetical protein